MGRLGKISTIRKEYNNSQLQTMQGGLSQKGMTRVPEQVYLNIHIKKLMEDTEQDWMKMQHTLNEYKTLQKEN